MSWHLIAFVYVSPDPGEETLVPTPPPTVEVGTWMDIVTETVGQGP